MGKSKQQAKYLFSVALAKECYYAGIKATNTSFNGEMPYVEIEHTQGTDISDQIDDDSAVAMLFINDFQEIVNKVVAKMKTGQAEKEIERLDTIESVMNIKRKK